MTLPVSSRAHADLALAVYLEPHVEGRRVLLLGEPEGLLADRFDELALHLEIIDPAAREPSRGEVPELPFDDESFDLVLVCDVATLPEPAEGAVRELSRVLARSGLLALVGSPVRRRGATKTPGRAAEGAQRQRAPEGAQRQSARAPESGLRPHSLETLLSGEFRNVRVLAQTALAGYAVGELEPKRGDEVSVDSSLVRGLPREPERLLGLASAAVIPAEGRLWIEVPPVSGDSSVALEASQGLVDELRRAEDEAREALHRESDVLRKLEVERRARLAAEQLVERARSFERKLLAAEADYDDAVARVRYFESAIAEHEATARHDRELRAASERELAHAKSELSAALSQKQRGEAERATARTEAEHAAGELHGLEQRLVELGQQVLKLEQDKKQHEETARDLLEELRRLEHDKSASVEQDARVAELEAERDRAVQRSLEAEVAREAAQMRADELRSELSQLEQAKSGRASAPAYDDTQFFAGAPEGALRHEDADRLRDDSSLARPRAGFDVSQREAALLRSSIEAARQRGEIEGLRLRLDEAERALASSQTPTAVVEPESGKAQVELADLRLRLAHTEALLHAMREVTPVRLRDAGERGDAVPSAPSAEEERAQQRVQQLEELLSSAERRAAELTRELEEADRFAELHAEDAERLTRVEVELETTRGLRDDVEDEARALDEELRTARIVHAAQQDDLSRARVSLEAAQAEVERRIEVAERHEVERDDARAALAEARSILSQLAGHVGADHNDPQSIVQAVVAQRRGPEDNESERVIDELRSNLQGRDARIQQLERWLNEARPVEPEPPIENQDN